VNTRRRNQRRKRGSWAHVNTPRGLRNRKAKADARREEIAARIVDPYRPPEPLTLWQSFTVDLYVPTAGHCHQHAAVINGERVGLLSATQIAAKLRGMIKPRPSQALQAEIRRDEWMDALEASCS